MTTIFDFLRRIRDATMNFATYLKYGRQAEDVFCDFFENKERFELTDVTWDEEYQEQEIDFIVKDREKGTTTTFEVKNATGTLKSNGTLAIEDHCVYKKDYSSRQGWLWTSKAHAFIFVDTDQELFYYINSKDLRKYIYEHNLKRNQLETYVYDENHKRTWVYYIKIEDLRALNTSDRRVFKRFITKKQNS